MLGQTGMAARTDCVVLGDDSALLMVTVRTTIPAHCQQLAGSLTGGC